MRRAVLLVVFLFLFSRAALLEAQTTFATITGSITDPTGLPIAGAQVQAVHLESGYKYQVQTNEAGVYTIPGLREGTYELTITAQGLKEAQVKDVQLVSRDVRRLDVKL